MHFPETNGQKPYGTGTPAFATDGCGEACSGGRVGWRCSAAGWGGDPLPPDAVSPWPGGAATRRWPTCSPGSPASRTPCPRPRRGRAPEEVEGEAAWRRRGRPGAHLGEQPKQRRPLRQELAMRWRPPSREERGAARREQLGGGDLSVERMG